MVSFAIRYYNCAGGVVVTASHNPAEYNGYKAYDADGCQLSGDASMQVTKAVENVDIFDGVKKLDYDEAVKSGMIELIGDDCYEDYYKNVISQSVNPDVFAKAGLKVIYTPIHGTGNRPVREVLKRVGVSDVVVVKEQETPDGNFPTAPYPNPEIRQPFECALNMAKDVQPDLLLGTDPDADRVGIAVRDGDDYRLLTGNEVGYRVGKILGHIMSVVRIERNESLGIKLCIANLADHNSVVIALEGIGMVAGGKLSAKGHEKLKRTVGHVYYRLCKRRIKLKLDKLRVAKLDAELIALLVFAVEMLVNFISVSLELEIAVRAYQF